MSRSHASDEVEPLEPRRLLAAAMAGTVLKIDGTTSNDTIVLSETAGKTGNYTVVIAGSTSTFAKKQVSKIIIHGNAGNDTITVKGLKSYKRVLSIYGDDGNDTITGSDSRDAILGGAGDDFISGGGGNDTLLGGDGDDVIMGGPGNDRIEGEEGHDTLYGDAGNDTLRGGGGNDVLAGDNEDFFNFAGKPLLPDITGNDLLDGGDGDDWLLCGTGNARISDKAGRDTLIGGEGADVIDGRGNAVIVDKSLADRDFVPNEDYAPASNEANDVHVQIKLTIQIRNRKGQYNTAVIPAYVGFFNVNTPATIQTRAADSIVYFDAPADSTWKLRDVFRMWGISFDSRHIGRYFASPTRALTVTIGGASTTDFENARLPVSGGATTEVVIKLG